MIINVQKNNERVARAIYLFLLAERFKDYASGWPFPFHMNCFPFSHDLSFPFHPKVVSKMLHCHRTPTEVHAYPDRSTCVPRPKYMRTPTEVHAYLGRGTITFRCFSELFLIFFRAFSDIFQSFFRCFSELFQIFFRAFSDASCLFKKPLLSLPQPHA